ncbi:MAG: hypothetical protein WCS57_01335 [Bacillota bacterium]|nr:hypothetical protein [Bacillota bacterium]
MQIRKTKVKRRSFGLWEMVLSVVVLTILGSFTVKMLITAKNMNSKSYDLYKGMSHAITLVETIKSVSDPLDLSEKDLEPGYSLQFKGEEVQITGYFDEDWDPSIPTKSHENACYWVIAKAAPLHSDGEDSEDVARVYKINVEVRRMVPYILEKSQEYQIFSLDSVKCYSRFVK